MALYRVMRSINPPKGNWIEKVEATGLDWEAAKRKEAELDAAEQKAHPNQTSWTRDIFYCERIGE
jgi:hypothetical protein